MRFFVTGATGFIGGRLAVQLRERGDEVVALVRSPQKAGRLREIGCELVTGDLGDKDVMQQAMAGCDGVFHVAAVYALGIPKSQQAAMLRSNVEGTENALDAAIAAGVPRIVYTSTVNVFGNTRGMIVAESYQRDLSQGFLSTYDEAKFRAHEVALDRIANGAPIVIVQPAGVYGPHDHSEIGNLIQQSSRGLLPLIPFASTAICLVHVDDVAAGHILAFEKGKLGESYILSGEPATFKEIVQKSARAGGKWVPRLKLPTAALKLSAPIGPVIGPIMGFNPNFREMVSASDGVSYLASDAKARAELGFAPRSLDDGLHELVGR